MKTRIIKVQQDGQLGRWAIGPDGAQDLNRWEVTTPTSDSLPSLSSLSDEQQKGAAAASAEIMAPLIAAGAYLRSSDIPVAFPTETVYGLGADATRTAAVKGIYAAKGRPSDNPLIVHVSDLNMLREYLYPRFTTTSPSPSQSSPSAAATNNEETIPAIYLPLIQRFWPGPLTILLPNPQPSKLAPEVTAGLATFGCRMPASALARTLIQLAGAPLAAPSANASTKPSPTAARHVFDDLEGRIELILDGGSCAVGVESTVVDGLCSPPVVLRPGGVSMDALRACPGWEGVEKAYKDHAEMTNGGGSKGAAAAPRAPGMKYKHYSPKARVVLYEAARGGGGISVEDLEAALGRKQMTTIAVIRTRHWPLAAGLKTSGLAAAAPADSSHLHTNGDQAAEADAVTVREGSLLGGGEDGKEDTVVARLLDVDLGGDIKGVAYGLFAALRELDRYGADVIFVEGVSDDGGGDDIAAAVMNRLRKAASDIRV
ncbi:telomere recombination-domain-containing protein [Podospora didyma]|uniref:Threonylcarbamoyl-AMP synthase n=1 Tax=Podospora didyma TaxID=330526 RepID=A0AAE0U6Y0_9PEZI|nr:telomere recombination-domain-containing protein [Podospora didyma]